jgi:hypothetical protein
MVIQRDQALGDRPAGAGRQLAHAADTRCSWSRSTRRNLAAEIIVCR